MIPFLMRLHSLLYGSSPGDEVFRYPSNKGVTNGIINVREQKNFSFSTVEKCLLRITRFLLGTPQHPSFPHRKLSEGAPGFTPECPRQIADFGWRQACAE
jgi:hypothetical protein